jgi:hypothetical protein
LSEILSKHRTEQSYLSINRGGVKQQTENFEGKKKKSLPKNETEKRNYHAIFLRIKLNNYQQIYQKKKKN